MRDGETEKADSFLRLRDQVKAHDILEILTPQRAEHIHSPHRGHETRREERAACLSPQQTLF